MRTKFPEKRHLGRHIAFTDTDKSRAIRATSFSVIYPQDIEFESNMSNMPSKHRTASGSKGAIESSDTLRLSQKYTGRTGEAFRSHLARQEKISTTGFTSLL